MINWVLQKNAFFLMQKNNTVEKSTVLSNVIVHTWAEHECEHAIRREKAFEIVRRL